MTEGKWMILGGVAAILFVAFYAIFYGGGGGKDKINEPSSPAEIVVQEVVRGVEASGKTGTMTAKAAEKQETVAVAEVAEQQKTEPVAINKDPLFDPAREKEEVSKTVIAFFDALSKDSATQIRDEYISARILEERQSELQTGLLEDIEEVKEVRKNISKMKILGIDFSSESKVTIKRCEEQGDFCTLLLFSLQRSPEGEWTITDIKRSFEEQVDLKPEEKLIFPAKVVQNFFAFARQKNIEAMKSLASDPSLNRTFIRTDDDYIKSFSSSKIEVVKQVLTETGRVQVLYSDKSGYAISNSVYLEKEEDWKIRHMNIGNEDGI